MLWIIPTKEDTTTEKKYIVDSVICGLLTAFGVVANIITMLNGSGVFWLLSGCAILLLLLWILFYAFIGYNKPHGNSLKYIMLVYAASDLINIPLLICIPTMTQSEIISGVVLLSIELGLTCYAAGRLSKAKKI